MTKTTETLQEKLEKKSSKELRRRLSAVCSDFVKGLDKIHNEAGTGSRAIFQEVTLVNTKDRSVKIQLARIIALIEDNTFERLEPHFAEKAVNDFLSEFEALKERVEELGWVND